jgi:glycosyltransferase involved in cell wall biosynthesis
MKILMLHFGEDDNPRACKIVHSLESAGHEVVFVGWERDRARAKRQVVPATRVLLLSDGQLNGRPGARAVFSFYRFMLIALWRERPDVVHCINEEMAALVIPLKRLLFRHMVLDVFDVLADRVETKNPLGSVLLRLVAWASHTFSDRIIVCDDRRFQRLGRFRRCAIILQNTPVDPGPQLSVALPTGPITVSMVGNITRRRGAALAVAALERVPGARLVTAGILDEYSAELFHDHPQIEYLGVLTPAQSLEVMAASDAVLAFYEPTTENHIFASPSKLFDCMSVGRPLIINAETKVSEWVIAEALGFRTPYYNPEALSILVRSLGEARSRLPEFANRVRRIYEQEYSWTVMEERLLTMYRENVTCPHSQYQGL